MKVGDAHAMGIDDGAIMAFYEAHWPRKTALSNAKFFAWQFGAAPADGGRNNCCVAVGDDGALLGVMGLNRHTYRLAGCVCDGAELTTWIAKPNTESLGVGGRMLSYLQQRYEVMLGSGISAQALPIYLKCGFRYLRSIPRHYRILSPTQFENVVDADPRSWRLAARMAAAAADGAAGVGRQARDADFAQREFTGRHGFVRSAEHLAWRYRRHPLFEYECLTVGDADGGHLVILRFGQAGDLRYCHWIDWLPAGTGKETMAVVRFVEERARDAGCAFVDFQSTRCDLNGALLASGWLSAVDDQFLQIPHLFAPVELRIPPTTSLIFWARRNFAELCDISQMHLTKGDLDLDRPTATPMHDPPSRAGIG